MVKRIEIFTQSQFVLTIICSMVTGVAIHVGQFDVYFCGGTDVELVIG